VVSTRAFFPPPTVSAVAAGHRRQITDKEDEKRGPLVFLAEQLKRRRFEFAVERAG